MSRALSNEMWLRPHEAVAVVRQHRPGSIGRTEALVKAAVSSGEVRSEDRGAEDYSLGRRRVITISVVSKDDLLDWLARNVPAPDTNRPRPRRAGKSGRVERAALAIWGEAGPPAHLEPKVICTEIRAWLKADEGSEPNITDKTIRDTVRKICK
jgi:hypothetical protein